MPPLKSWPEWIKGGMTAAFGGLVAYNATNAQRVSGLFTVGPAGAATAGTGAPGPTGAMMAPFLGSAAEDSTSAQTFEVTVQHSSSSGNVSIRLEFARIELCVP